jgi:hypothetical protein
MNPDAPLPDRLKAGSPGLGEASGTDIESRAVELARIDGRSTTTEADRARAGAELAGSAGGLLPPEAVIPAIAELTAWDDPVGQEGCRAGRVPLDDETAIAERLIQDGIDAAEHHRRVSAAGDGA